MGNNMTANNVITTAKGFSQFGNHEDTRCPRTDEVIQQ